MDFWTYLGEPFQYSFMTRAFVGVSLIALLAGILGTLIMLKGLAFIADAIAHAGFGGLVGALILGLPLQLGALSVGLATAIILTIIGRTTKLKEDTTLAILFTGAFSLGILGLATQPAFAGNLTAILVGSVLAISPQDIYWIGAVVLLTVGFVVSFLRQLVFICFDPMGAEAAGLPVAVLQLGLLSLIAAAVVVSLQTVGAILVVALLITPAATAYLFTDRLTSLMAWAVFFGLGASWIGLYLSYYFALPTGAIIVVVATAQFALVFLALRLRPILGVVFKGLAGRVSLGLRK